MTNREIYKALEARKTAFMRAFSEELVMEDLGRFCFEKESCFHESQRVTDLRLGRHEVWLWIKQYLDLSVDELIARRGGIRKTREVYSDVD